MGCFKPTSYHHDPVVVKCKTMGDIFEMKYFVRFTFHSLDTYFVSSPVRLFLEGITV